MTLFLPFFLKHATHSPLMVASAGFLHSTHFKAIVVFLSFKKTGSAGRYPARSLSASALLRRRFAHHFVCQTWQVTHAL